MGRTVFADANRIVSENVYVRQLRERRETDRGPAVIGENQKRRSRRAENSVIGNAVHDRAHGVFANSEMNVATCRRFPGKIVPILDVVQGRPMKIGAAADEKRHCLGERLEGVAAGFPGRDLRVLREFRDLR